MNYGNALTESKIMSKIMIYLINFNAVCEIELLWINLVFWNFMRSFYVHRIRRHLNRVKLALQSHLHINVTKKRTKMEKNLYQRLRAMFLQNLDHVAVFIMNGISKRLRSKESLN